MKRTRVFLSVLFFVLVLQCFSGLILVDKVYGIVITGGSDSWTNKSVTVTAERAYEIHVVGPEEYYSRISHTVTISTEGIYEVLFYSTISHQPGIPYTPLGSATVKIDKTSPVLNIIGVNEQWQSVDSVTIEGQASDSLSGIKSIQYKFDNGAWQTGAKAVVTKEGETKVQFRATDNVGNVTTSKSTIVRIDRTPPVFLESTTNEKWQSAEKNIVSVGAYDTYNDVKPFEYSYDGYLWFEGNEVIVSDEGETDVWHRATDSVGNSAVKKVTIRLDRTSPEIEISNPAVEASDFKEATVSCILKDTYSGIDASTVEYSLDEGEWLKGNSVKVQKDGETKVSFRARDNAGNRVEKAEKVYLDCVAPTISEAFLCASNTDEAMRFFDAEYTDITEIYAWVAGSDMRRGEITKPKEYIYTVRQNPSKAGRSYHVEGDKTSFRLDGLTKGANYISIKAVDAAGNESEVKLLIIKIGNGIPGTPSIRSKTHPYANTVFDAVKNRNPIFLITPNNPDLLDTKEYIYTLKKGEHIIVDSQRTAQPQIQFTELEDNIIDEFYELTVLTVGGNNKVSEKPAKYIFRIDSTPPDMLTVTSETHTVEGEWYKEALARFEWNKPVDFTGVRFYYYKLASKELGINDTKGWTVSEDTYVAVDLLSVHQSEAKNGECYFAVWAEDYSGNIQFDTMKVLFDLEKPYLSEADGNTLTAVLPEGLKNCINLSWSEARDNVAIGDIALCISDSPDSLETASWIHKTKTDTYHLFTELDDEKTYVIKLKISDMAGNTRTYLKTAKADGTTPAAITINYSTNIAGYTVEGASEIDGSGSTAVLVVPSSLGAAIDRIPFNEKIIIEGGEFVSGESNQTFSLNLHGFNMQVKGILLNQGGLTLKEVSVRPANASTDIMLKNVRISAPPDFTIIKSDVSDTEIQEYKLSDFEFSSIAKSGFQSNQWVIYDGKLNAQSFNCFTQEQGVKNYLLPVRNVAFSADGKLKSGMIATDFILGYGKNRYIIEEGNCLFKNGQLLINKASIGESNVSLLYFKVSKDGIPVEEDGFKFEIKEETTSSHLQLEGLKFNNGHLVLSKGIANTDVGIKMLLENLAIEDGIIVYSESGIKLILSDTFNPLFESKQIKVSEFKSDLDGKSLEAKLRLGELKGIAGGYYTLKEGSIYLKADNKEIATTLQGEIELGSDNGTNFEEVMLKITEAELDEDCNILSIKATTNDIPQIEALRNTKFYKGSLYMAYNTQISELPELGIEGNIDIPGIAEIVTNGQGLPINKLIFNRDGKLDLFEVSAVKSGDEITNGFFTSIADDEGNTFKSVVLSATYDSEADNIIYEMSGTLVLSDSFPGQFSGNEIYIEKMYFDCNGDIYGINAQRTLPPKLGFMGKAVLENGTVSLEANESITDFDIVFKGSLRIATNIKELSELYIDVERLSFTRNGVIKQVIAGRRIDGIQSFIDNISLKDAQISAYTDSFQKKLIVSVNGTVVFTLDAGEVYVPAMELNVNKLLINQDGNIEDMSIAANLPGTRPFIGKSILRNVGVVVTKDIDSTLVADLKGQVIVPEFINEKDLLLEVNKFSVEQNGSIRAMDIRGSIEGEEEFLGGTKLKDCSAGLIKDNKDTPVQIDLGGTIVLPEMEIQSLSHLELQIQSLRFDMHGDLKRVSAALQFQEEFELIDGVKLRNARIELSGEEGKTYQIGISGTMLMASTAPGNLAGAELTINKFIFDLEGNLIELDAQLGLENVDLIGTVKIQEGLVKVLKPETGRVEFSIAGTLLLPETAPGNLKAAEIPIKIFKIDTSGDIKAFEASVILTGDKKLFGDIVRAKDLQINASFTNEKEMEFGINGEVLFNGAASDSGGFNMVLRAFTVTQSGAIKALDLSAENVNASLFGLLDLSNGTVKVIKDNSTGDNLIDIKGIITAGSKLPEGLPGTNISLHSLVIDLDGGIREFENTIGEILIYSGMKLINGKFYVENEDSNYIVGISGQIILGTSFPKDFREKVINIEQFKLDKQGNIHALKMGLEGINTDFFDALYVKNSSFSAVKDNNSRGILWSITGDVSLGTMFPESICSKEITLNKFTISTKGEIKELNASIFGTTTFNIYCNIKAIANKINISKDGLSVEGSVEFPSSFPTGLANTQILLRKLELGWKGSIKDIEAVIGHMEIKPAGFRVGIDNLSIEEDRVSIGKCILILPSNMNNKQLGIQNATIDKNGRFSGEFIVSDIEHDFGFGTLNLTGISLDIDSKQIAFKKATFGFSKDLGKDVMVGLNGVKIEPDGMRFTGGAFKISSMKISEALTIRNAYLDFKFGEDFYLEGGATIVLAHIGPYEGKVSFVKRSTTYPIGLKYAEFTFSIPGPGIQIANTGLFIKTITGGMAFGAPTEVPSQLRYMFQSGMRMKMGIGFQDGTGGDVVKGNATMWLDIKNASMALKGNVKVLRGLASGEALSAISSKGMSGTVNLDMTYAEGRAEFYFFKYNGSPKVSGNGRASIRVKKGSAGSVRIKFGKGWFSYKVTFPFPPISFTSPEVGTKFGMFTNGKNGISAYVKVGFFGINREVGVFVSKNGFAAGGIDSYEIYRPNGIAFKKSDHLLNSSYLKNMATEDELDEDLDDMQGVSDLLFNVSSKNDIPVEEIILLAAGLEPSHEVRLISPSGKIYGIGSPNVEASIEDDRLALAVLKPEVGVWKIKVLGGTGYSVPGFGVLGFNAIPEISVDNPRIQGETVAIKGSAINSAKGDIVEIYFSENSDSYTGAPVAEAKLDENGNYSATVDLTTIVNGKFYVFAVLNPASGLPAVHSLAKETLTVNLVAQRLKPVKAFIVAENKEGNIEIKFEDVNGDRASGFNLYVENVASKEFEKLNLGYVTDTYISGYEKGSTLKISVIPYDNDNLEGESSKVIVLDVGREIQSENVFEQTSEELRVNVVRGMSADCSIKLKNSLPKKTDTAYDYADIKLLDYLEGVNVSFENTLNIAQAESDIDFNVEGYEVGDYIVNAIVENRGNREICKKIKIIIKVTRPDITVKDTNLAIEGNEATTVEVEGSNFDENVKVYLNNTLLEALESDDTIMKVSIPEKLSYGEHKLRVVGGNGDEHLVTLEVLEPLLILTPSRTIAYSNFGATEVFSFKGQSINGFKGNAKLTVDIPEGWTANFNKEIIGINETCKLSIKVPQDISAGLYTMNVSSDNGQKIPLSIYVYSNTNNKPEPYISGISDNKGICGDKIKIFGGNFIYSCKAYIGGREVPATIGSHNEIELEIKENTISGDIVLSINGREYTVGKFYMLSEVFLNVKDEKTSIKGSKIELWSMEYDAGSIFYRINYGQFKQYTEGFILSPGNNRIEAYSIDSKGIKNASKLWSVKCKVKANISNNVFKDINGHWAEQNIQRLYEEGLLAGYPDKTIRPEKEMSRAELLMMIIKILNLEPSKFEVADLKNVESIPRWINKGYIKTAIDNGILKVNKNSILRLNEKVTRAEATEMLIKAFEVSESDISLSDEEKNAIEKWAKDNIVGYKPQAYLNSKYLKRSEIFVMICKCLENYKVEDESEVLVLDYISGA